MKNKAVVICINYRTQEVTHQFVETLGDARELANSVEGDFEYVYTFATKEHREDTAHERVNLMLGLNADGSKAKA